MDTSTIFGFILGYLASMAGVFLLYLPDLVLLVALLIAAGVLQLILLPFILLVRTLRRRQDADTDSSWLLDRGG
ncbi:hypothetical protein [Arthrobacter bambusae]|uniref:hypothetical protein n=1 Tax=Arthrobacter bambusae TaxID=1338426 RepID=UPI0027875A85|nr:hypothetical protein [Arthrobacter bambusae]MDQ0029950.1 cytochrome c-type biogenesis protein CcmH/NrfF [Arthrobacter bambusae]MDQ0097532.1 cytochrome c-type biogenesis protein CcmH/NrfF [Arthrobacter bambusae]